MNYRPLPDYLTIKESSIDGLGLFCIKDIKKDTNAGITHFIDPVTEQLYRTPLGGFINHSETPNAELIEVQGYKYLKFLTDIAEGEEITLKYTLYNPLKSINKSNKL